MTLLSAESKFSSPFFLFPSFNAGLFGAAGPIGTRKMSVCIILLLLPGPAELYVTQLRRGFYYDQSHTYIQQ